MNNSNTQFHVLVTGFVPFRNFSENPSQLISENLNGKTTTLKNGSSIHWTGIQLSVDHVGAETVSKMLISEGNSQYDAIVHLGLSGNAKAVNLENIARNIRVKEAGESNRVIVESEPEGELRPSTGFLAAVNTAKINSVFGRRVIIHSCDCGDYYCNECYYTTLATIKQHSLTKKSTPSCMLPCVFVHVPETKAPNDGKFVSLDGQRVFVGQERVDGVFSLEELQSIIELAAEDLL
eukprot:GCRY01002997.1.p1 GENE.GCRY01002997.1~~GCRY01002997.1.p1  ORF type:complete len:236 (+),score=32.64 GCRY01002997.1:192-899(+)